MTFGQFLGVIMLVIVLVVLAALFFLSGTHAALIALAVVGATIVVAFVAAVLANSNN